GVWRNGILDCLLCTTVKILKYDQLFCGNKGGDKVSFSMDKSYLFWLLNHAGSHDGAWLDYLLCTTAENLDYDQCSIGSSVKRKTNSKFYSSCLSGHFSCLFGYGGLKIRSGTMKSVYGLDFVAMELLHTRLSLRDLNSVKDLYDVLNAPWI
ncbi:hypothetical protein Tco_1012533, partial [Tanacetum coccineum]